MMLLTILVIIQVSYATPRHILKNISSNYDWTQYHKLEEHYQFLHNLALTYPRPGVVQAGLGSDRIVGKIPNNPSGRKCRSNTKQSKFVTGEDLYIWQGKV